MSPVINCESCRHYRRPQRPEPFSASEMGSSAAVDEWVTWNEKMQERERREREQIGKGIPFPYEPWFVPWCEHYSALASMEALKNGKFARLFVPATWKNRDHDCERYVSSLPLQEQEQP